MTLPTNKGPMTIDQLVDHLTYVNYACNRDRSPEITAEQWAGIFSNAAAMEVRYQAEKAINKARINADLDAQGL